MVGTAVDDDEDDEDGAIISSTSSTISITLLDERLDARNGLRVVEVRRPRAAGVVDVAAGVRLGAELHINPY